LRENYRTIRELYEISVLFALERIFVDFYESKASNLFELPCVIAQTSEIKKVNERR